jgi:hypothetical protein
MGTTSMVGTVYPSEAGFICHNHIPLSSSLFFTECDISGFFFTEVSDKLGDNRSDLISYLKTNMIWKRYFHKKSLEIQEVI